MNITYTIELADCFDGRISSTPANGGYHYLTQALARKLADRLDQIKGNEAFVIKHGECFFDPLRLHDAHYWAFHNVNCFDDIPF